MHRRTVSRFGAKGSRVLLCSGLPSNHHPPSVTTASTTAIAAGRAGGCLVVDGAGVKLDVRAGPPAAGAAGGPAAFVGCSSAAMIGGPPDTALDDHHNHHQLCASSTPSSSACCSVTTQCRRASTDAREEANAASGGGGGPTSQHQQHLSAEDRQTLSNYLRQKYINMMSTKGQGEEESGGAADAAANYKTAATAAGLQLDAPSSSSFSAFAASDAANSVNAPPMRGRAGAKKRKKKAATLAFSTSADAPKMDGTNAANDYPEVDPEILRAAQENSHTRLDTTLEMLSNTSALLQDKLNVIRANAARRIRPSREAMQKTAENEHKRFRRKVAMASIIARRDAAIARNTARYRDGLIGDMRESVAVAVGDDKSAVLAEDVLGTVANLKDAETLRRAVGKKQKHDASKRKAKRRRAQREEEEEKEKQRRRMAAAAIAEENSQYAAALSGLESEMPRAVAFELTSGGGIGVGGGDDNDNGVAALEGGSTFGSGAVGHPRKKKGGHSRGKKARAHHGDAADDSSSSLLHHHHRDHHHHQPLELPRRATLPIVDDPLDPDVMPPTRAGTTAAVIEMAAHKAHDAVEGVVDGLLFQTHAHTHDARDGSRRGDGGGKRAVGGQSFLGTFEHGAPPLSPPPRAAVAENTGISGGGVNNNGTYSDLKAAAASVAAAAEDISSPTPPTAPVNQTMCAVGEVPLTDSGVLSATEHPRPIDNTAPPPPFAGNVMEDLTATVGADTNGYHHVSFAFPRQLEDVAVVIDEAELRSMGSSKRR